MRGENRIFALLKRRIRHVELFCNRLPLLCNLKPVGLLVRATGLSRPMTAFIRLSAAHLGRCFTRLGHHVHRRRSVPS